MSFAVVLLSHFIFLSFFFVGVFWQMLSIADVDVDADAAGNKFCVGFNGCRHEIIVVFFQISFFFCFPFFSLAPFYAIAILKSRSEGVFSISLNNQTKHTHIRK